tara:strand:+ start:142 stop:1212 length:1071 start_codon:yes stop_codon:yes gene_type:complete
MSVDEEWSKFLDNINEIKIPETHIIPEGKVDIDRIKVPKCTEIYISTKTKIIYLSTEILDIYSIFWKIPIIDYDKQEEGIIKKQIKISCVSKEEVDILEDKIKQEEFNSISKILNDIDNPDGRIKFKHVRKISIGLCKKDLIYARTKEKSAFYNCYVITLRVKYNGVFKEIHVKMFNTGKLEIPGIQNDEILKIVLYKLLEIFSILTKEKLSIQENKTENVLINSNFNCGFYINREALFNLLRYKYNINASYDPCSYPGIQCVYYYDYLNKVGISKTANLEKNKKDKNMQKISYMIFRTGSILIVGKCSEDVLRIVYEYVKNILISEYSEIMTSDITTINAKTVKTKLRKKIIYMK